MDAKQVPLRELLASVPADARLVIDDADGKGTRFIPVGRLCQEAAAALAEPPGSMPQHERLKQMKAQRKAMSDLTIADIYVKWDATPGASMADFARAIERAHGIGK